MIFADHLPAHSHHLHQRIAAEEVFVQRAAKLSLLGRKLSDYLIDLRRGQIG